jgi:zinc protease
VESKTMRAAVFAVVASLLLTAVACLGSEPKIKVPPIEFKMPKVDTLMFANGLHGYLIENHEIPVVDIVIRFKTGYPAEDKTGLNELAGWALRNGGTSKYSKETLDDELEFLGASIETYPSGGGRMFGQGAPSGTYIGQVSANFLTKDMDKVLDMFSEVITHPVFDSSMIELRRKSMIEDIRRKADEPGQLGRSQFAKLVYGDHPAGREATAKTVNGITRDDVVAFHARYVRPNNAVIGISGDITRQQALDKVNAFLAGWQRGGETPTIPEMTYHAVPSVNYIYKDVNQAYIYVGHMGVNAVNPDVPYIDIMNFVLGGGSFTSWIMQRVRSDEGLAYSAGSRYSGSPYGYGIFTASCQTRSDAAMRALGLVIEQINRMKDQGPSAEEVGTAKDSFINTQVFDYESSSGLVNRLAWFDIVGLPLDTLERQFKAYQTATLADVDRVAKQYLHPDGLTILVVGNQDRFDRPLSDFGRVNVITIQNEEVPTE